MLGYFVRRVLQSVFVLWGVSLITFLIPSLFTLNIARQILGQHATAATMAHFNHRFGFDQSIWVQYWRYMDHLFHGNLGISFGKENYSASVGSIVFPALQETLWLVMISIVLSLLIAIPLGMLQALKRNSVFDYVATSIVFVLYSIPAFLLGILLIILLSTTFHIFPFEIQPTLRTGAFARLLDIITDPRSWVLPVAVLVGISVGGYSRFMRGSVLDVLVQDYTRTARAKGASSTRVLYRHAMRNAIIPILTILGLTLPALFSGAIITESLFNIGGMGTVVVTATKEFDMPVLMAATLLVALATVTGNFLADVAVSIADPRVRLTGKR